MKTSRFHESNRRKPGYADEDETIKNPRMSICPQLRLGPPCHHVPRLCKTLSETPIHNGSGRIAICVQEWMGITPMQMYENQTAGIGWELNRWSHQTASMLRGGFGE